MKKLYSIFAFTFLLNFFACLHWSFANENLPKDALPVSRPKPVFKVPFKPLPFKTLLPNVELYEFNAKDFAFEKIVGLQPILIGKDWQKVINDPIKFTLTPSKPTAILGEEMELTLTAELLDISPKLLFTFEELRNYSIKIILPQDFIQTGGTYLNSATGTLDPANPKHTYTIKGRYLDKPALDDCFKILRKLNENVFVLKSTACIDVKDIDVVSTFTERVNGVREVSTGIDLSKVNFITYLRKSSEQVQQFGNNFSNSYDLKCNDGGNYDLVFLIDDASINEVRSKGGSFRWYFFIDGILQNEFDCDPRIAGMTYKVSNKNVFSCQLNIYSSATNCSAGSFLGTKTQNVNFNRSECPTNFLTITTNETSLCPGVPTTITTNTNCPAASISWQKNGLAYGANGATTSVNTSGAYKAVCNSPALFSNTISINVSNTPTVPTVKTNRYSITPGEFATLTATNCQGTVVWQGPNNFTDTGDEISVGKQGNYQAHCRSNCNGTVYYSDLSTVVSISLLPLRLEADKYEKYSNETAQISAYGCNNGYISWKVNGAAIPQSDNPLTAYAAGAYSAQCRSFNGAESDWVALYISEKTSNTPFVTASKTDAFPTDNVTLSASGCPSGWFYKWKIPVTANDNSVTIQRPVGTPQTVRGPGNYKVQCILNDQNQSAYTSVKVNPLNIGEVRITITANKTEANIGEPVVFTVTGNCPNGGGIRWIINGMNYWSYVGETFTGSGPGTYAARCESGPQISQTVYYIVKAPKPGGTSIVSDKTRAKDNELVTLRAIGCGNEVNWTLPNGTEVAGSTILFNFGPGTYKAKCVNKFGFTSEPASLTIANRNWDEPSITQTNTSIATNQLGEMQIQGCPNDWVQWAIPRKDANGNEVKDANGQTIYDYTGGKILIFKGPGVYKVRCSIGDYSNNFQNIVVQAAPTNSLFLKASRNVAKPDESVTITAYGCPNGTVTWKNGNQTATGTQITVTEPGVRMAKCTGDYSNNGDWALAQIRNDGNITPYLNASVYEACPNQPVTVTATGCPNGWWYQTRWIKPGQLDYWLANRNAPVWEVYNYGSSNETKNGSNLYSARCISPDGSWMGDFDEKSITVEPAFPADLRATNNGPALMGATSVKLAVTDVPGATYAWSGPNGYVSGLRSPEILTPTEDRTGVYTVTVTKGAGQPWVCNATATTNLKVSGCDIRIKASDVITGEEGYILPFAEGSITQFRDLALSAIRYDGTEPQGLSYTWTKPDGTTANSSILVTNKPGRYSLSVSPIDNPSIVCKSFVTISESSAYKMLFTKVKNKVFPDGTPVKMVPLQYEEMYYTLTRNGVEEKIDIAENYLLFYTSGGVKKVDMMQVIPTFDYNQTHGVIDEADFSGLILFTEKDGKTFKKGWRFNNGVLNQTITTTNLHQARAKNPNDDCVIKKWATQTTTFYYKDKISTDKTLNPNELFKAGSQTSTIYSYEINLDCCLIAPAGCGPNNPNNPPPFGTGGGVAEPEPSYIAKKICPQYTTLLGESLNNTPKQQIVNTNCSYDESAIARFSVYAKLIDESIKKEFAKNPTLQPYISKMTPATDAQINSASSGYIQTALNGADPSGIQAAGCALTQNFQADPAHPITPDVEDVMTVALTNASNDVKLAYNALSKLLNPCSSSQNCSAPSPQALAVMNTIMTSLKARKGAAINGFQWTDFGDRMGMEAGDIKNVFNDLVAASGVPAFPNPSKPDEFQLLPLNGPFSNIKFIYNSTTNQLDIKSCDNTISMMDATVPPPMNDCMAVIPNNGRTDTNPIYPYVKESMLNTLSKMGESMQEMGVVNCSTCSLTNKGDWGENTYWLFKSSDGNHYWIVRELGTTNYRYAYDADPKINKNDNLQWTSWEPDFGEEITAGAKFSQNTALAFAGTLGVFVSAPIIVGTVIPALIQSASTITLEGVMEEVIINTMLSLATDGNINPNTLAKSTVDDIFTDKLIKKIPSLIGKKFQIPIKTFNVLKDWLIKKGSNTVSLSYLQNIKTIAKPFTDKVRIYADAIRNKIDDLCGNAKDKIKITATSLKLFDNIDDVVKLFDKTNPTKTININGKIFGEVAGAANGETVKMFEGATQTEIRQYAENLAGGVLTEVSPGKVWTKIAADGTKVNLRNISKSNISDWTIDVINDAKLTPIVKQKGIEIKFR